MLDFEPFREIYLVFHDDASYIFSSFIKTGFKHVFALERQALGWTCIDPSRTDLSSMVLPSSYHIDIIPEFMRNNPTARILKLKVYASNKSTYPRAGIISCVSTIQYLIGVYWPHILTPYQLYNKLCKYNNPNIRVVILCQAAERQEEGQTGQHRTQLTERNLYDKT